MHSQLLELNESLMQRHVAAAQAIVEQSLRNYAFDETADHSAML